MLEVKQLSVSYAERVVLKDIDFKLRPGKVLGMIGPNGAGKSTLVRALSGVIPIRGGKMFFKGRDLSQLGIAERARLISVVPQASQLPQAFSVRETVILGRTPYLNWLGHFSDKDEEIAEKAMKRTDTLGLAERHIGELSGGEQQRVLLARALAQATPILLLDEPTSHLDLQHQINLLDQVRQLACKDQLCVLITIHDLNLASRYADEIALLVDGALEAIGSPVDVLTPGVLSQAYRIPLQVFQPAPGSPPLIVPV